MKVCWHPWDDNRVLFIYSKNPRKRWNFCLIDYFTFHTTLRDYKLYNSEHNKERIVHPEPGANYFMYNSHYRRLERGLKVRDRAGRLN